MRVAVLMVYTPPPLDIEGKPAELDEARQSENTELPIVHSEISLQNTAPPREKTILLSFQVDKWLR